MKIVVTGGSGFIGKNFLGECALNGIEAHQIGRNASCKSTPFYNGDLRERKLVIDIIKNIQPTHIFHFASKGVTRGKFSLQDLIETNVFGTDNILFASSQLKQKPYIFVFGSSYEYEASDFPVNEQAKLNPMSLYALSKTTSYYAMRQYQDLLSINYLRLFNIYGPGEPAERIIPYVLKSIKEKTLIKLTACEQIRDFMFVNDLIRILFRLASLDDLKNPGLKVLNVGTGIKIKLKELIALIFNQCAFKNFDDLVKFGALPYRSEDPMTSVADNKKLLATINGFNFTSLKHGLEQTIEKYERHE
jgi:nucleoside-diphosphate-sugar epimerase